LASGHANIDAYLKRIGREDSDRCWYCNQAGKTRRHLFGGCKKWKVEYRSLIRKVDQKVKKNESEEAMKGLRSFYDRRLEMLIIRYLNKTEIGRNTRIVEAISRNG
jgi:hypothetical protein